MKWKMSEQINITVGHSRVKLTVMLFELLSDKQNLFDAQQPHFLKNKHGSPQIRIALSLISQTIWDAASFSPSTSKTN